MDQLIDPCFTSFTCSDTNNNNYNFVTIFYFQNYICTVMLQIYNSQFMATRAVLIYSHAYSLAM